ncbi:premnaspirodiene oxygenase-like isoform X2 [Gossypium australe]|uniref:Premnaspirodiene oxygenase-like isoform X2 n=1 Tax=Gossypium australe TaxID=47621 RepID=A0A5B6VE11_9ROSI|nr:premnaspirodiene oxygenase-like isoform X2 [Gossypium australe]
MLLQRENTERCEVNGYEIPAKTKVIVNAWAIGRDSNYWNEAERFNPERFINCSVDYKGANFEFIPFGAGRRMCPGMSYGMAVVELSLAQLLYHFDWKLPNGMKTEDLDMTDAFGVTARRKRDLYLIPTPYYPAPSIQYDKRHSSLQYSKFMEHKFFSSPILFTLIIFVLMLVKLGKRFRANNLTPNLPPRPWKLPVIGSLHHLAAVPLPHKTLRNTAKRLLV